MCSGELLRVIKVAHLSHMTSISWNKLTPAEWDKSLEHEQLISARGGCYAGFLNMLSPPQSCGNGVHEWFHSGVHNWNIKYLVGTTKIFNNGGHVGTLLMCPLDLTQQIVQTSSPLLPSEWPFAVSSEREEAPAHETQQWQQRRREGGMHERNGTGRRGVEGMPERWSKNRQGHIHRYSE